MKLQERDKELDQQRNKLAELNKTIAQNEADVEMIHKELAKESTELKAAWNKYTQVRPNLKKPNEPK